MLAALILTFHHNAGGQVGDADGGLGFIDVLPAGAARTEGVDLKVRRIDVNLHFFGLGQHGHGNGGGVDTALGLGVRHALHAVHARLEFQAAVNAVSLDEEADFLDASQLGLV